MTDPFNHLIVVSIIALVMFAMIVFVNKTQAFACKYCGGKVGKHRSNCPFKSVE